MWEYYANVIDVSYENVLDPNGHHFDLWYTKFLFPLSEGTDEFVFNERYKPSPLASWRLL